MIPGSLIFCQNDLKQHQIIHVEKDHGRKKSQQLFLDLEYFSDAKTTEQVDNLYFVSWKLNSQGVYTKVFLFRLWHVTWR
jgi:hypothetical protein